MVWDPSEIHERPWPGPDGNSVQYEIGAAGIGAPVVVIATPGKPGGYVSCRSLSYAEADTVRSLADCLQAAAYVLDTRHSGD